MNDDLEQHSAAAGATEGTCLGVSNQARTPPLKQAYGRFKKWALQRTTWLGLGLISLGLAGVEWQCLPEDAIATLFSFGLLGLVPEDWVILRQALTFFAPVLAHQLVQHRLATMSGSVVKPTAKQPEAPSTTSPSSLF